MIDNSQLDTVLGQLNKWSKTGDQQWEACCSVHEDRNPSMSIALGDNGSLVFRCHVGCTYEEIVARLNVDQTLPPLPSPVKSRGNGIVKPPRVYATREEAIEAILRWPGLENSTFAGEWIYFNDDGSESMRTLRFDKPDGSKEIRPLTQVEDGWIVKRPTGQWPIYNLEEVKNAGPYDIIYICEGEKTCEAGRSIGLICTTSAGGSNGAKRTNWMPVKQSKARLICILPDNDVAGKEYANTIAEMLQTIGGAK